MIELRYSCFSKTVGDYCVVSKQYAAALADRISQIQDRLDKINWEPSQGVENVLVRIEVDVDLRRMPIQIESITGTTDPFVYQAIAQAFMDEDVEPS